MKLKIISCLIIAGFLTVFMFNSCKDSENENTDNTDTVETVVTKYADTVLFKWETPAELKTPESVKYDPVRNLLYVANINGNPTDKDENGFISKVSLDGEIIELEWVRGLNAPKGMGIFNNKLYVTDIDKLVEIDIEKAEIIKDYPIKDAQFLNDIDVDKNGNVYVSDMTSDRIFRLANDTFAVWLQSPEFENPNGLFADNNNLLVGVNGKILSVFLETKEINTFIDSTGGIDGLETLKNDQFVFSDWEGHIHFSFPGKGIKLILNTAKDTVQAADIEYCPDKDMILVPTFFHNTVSAYKVVRK